MKTYFIEIVKDGETLDVASTQSPNHEGAAKVIDAAARGRGWEGFSVREVTEEYFIAFKNQKQEEAAIAEAAAQPVTQPGLEAAAGGTEGNAANTGTAESSAGPDAALGAQAEGEAQAAADPAPAEDNSESLAGDSQGTPVAEGTHAAQENPAETSEGQTDVGEQDAAEKAA